MSAEERLMDYRISRIVSNEIENEGGFTAEFCELAGGNGPLSLYLGTWLGKRLSVKTRQCEIEYRCRLSSGDGILEQVKLPARVPEPCLDDLQSDLSLSREETRYVEVLLAMSISGMSKSEIPDGERLSLVVGASQFPKIAGKRDLTRGVIEMLDQPVEYRVGLLFERRDGRWWDGCIPLYRVRPGDGQKSEGMRLLIALERSLGAWAKRAEGCGARGSGDRYDPGTSTVSLHLIKKRAIRRGYYRLCRTAHVEDGSEVESVLFYNAYWDHLTLLKPLGRWLQGRITEGERGSFSSVAMNSQHIERRNVDSSACYSKRCVRLHDGRGWAVVLLVKNDGMGSSFSCDRSLLEGTLGAG